MKPISSFGVVAFKKTREIDGMCGRILAWSERGGVPVFFHPVLASSVQNAAYMCNSEAEFLAKSEALVAATAPSFRPCICPISPASR
jgi:hypothetical protein